MNIDDQDREIWVEYSAGERMLYNAEDPVCIYPQWPAKYGIHRAGGNFPAMVARKYFEDQGYSVLKNGYYLMREAYARENNPGFQFIREVCGEEKVRKVIQAAELLRLRGGDPDLFVYKDDRTEFFFAEVKENDKITGNQKKLIPLIRRFMCPVYIVRVKRDETAR